MLGHYQEQLRLSDLTERIKLLEVLRTACADAEDEVVTEVDLNRGLTSVHSVFAPVLVT